MPPDAARQVLLDITRTVSRLADGGASGVDRVERAYLDRCLSQAPDARFLARVAGGAAVLDGDGARALLDEGAARRGDAVALVSRRVAPARRLAETAVRAHARGWAVRARLPALLRRHLRPGFVLVNVGHTHLGARTLEAARRGGAGRIAVMVHDMIPLDHPDFARPAPRARFEAEMQAVAARADLVICNSAHTAQRARDWMGRWGRVPEILVVHLGCDGLGPAVAPQGGSGGFLALGTIEPRKNHALLLDVWEEFAATLAREAIPRLDIVGRRGWAEPALFARLDAAADAGRNIHLHGHLHDTQLAALIAGARALLFPTLAEGFGFPLVEALRARRPVIASDLSVFREIAPRGPTYLDPRDRDAWAQAILRLHEAPDGGTRPPDLDFPDWEWHFRTVWPALLR